jgi:hypothetical protein
VTTSRRPLPSRVGSTGTLALHAAEGRRLGQGDQGIRTERGMGNMCVRDGKCLLKR